MKNFTALFLVFSSAAFAQNPYIFMSVTLDPGQVLRSSIGITLGPKDIGGQLTAHCTRTDTSTKPPHLTTVALDTTPMYVWIGISYPSGQRGPCHVNTSYSAGAWQPTAWPPEYPYSWSDGVGAGVKLVQWTYLGVPYNEKYYQAVWCDPLVEPDYKNTFPTEPPYGYPC